MNVSSISFSLIPEDDGCHFDRSQLQSRCNCKLVCRLYLNNIMTVLSSMEDCHLLFFIFLENKQNVFSRNLINDTTVKDMTCTKKYASLYVIIIRVNNIYFVAKTSQYQRSLYHCVPRAPVCEVQSRPYLFAYCLNIYHTMHFVQFCPCRNAAFKLRGRNWAQCIVYTYFNNRRTGKDTKKLGLLGHSVYVRGFVKASVSDESHAWFHLSCKEHNISKDLKTRTSCP